MIKKILTTVLILFCTYSFASSKEVQVKVVPNAVLSTSDKNLQEGDSISLITAEDVYVNSKLVIKKGEPVLGTITNLVNNDFTCQPASIYAENFKVKNINGETEKLNGIVYKSGRNHSYITQYMPDATLALNLFFFIRGGEAKILPNKDSFILYFDDDKKREPKNDL